MVPFLWIVIKVSGGSRILALGVEFCNELVRV